jgi:ribosomal protein S18 acetylase RimI-like enzyme
MQSVANITIREGLPSDIGAVVNVDEFAQAHPERADFIAASIANGECFIAEIGADVAGFAVLNYSFFGFGFIPVLVVARAYRRQGVGRRLAVETQLRCKSRKLFTSANASNVAALALFARAGFIRSGNIENLDEGDSEIVMFLSSGLA